MIRVALAIAVFALSLGAQAADAVAFVADLKGNATIEGDGKLNFLAELAPGTRLLLGTGATVAVTYAASGDEFTFNGPGEFLVSPGEVKAEKGAAPTRRKVTSLADPGIVARVSRTASASLRMRGGTRPAAPLALEYPVNTRVASLRPQLRWSGVAPAEGFTVKLAEADGREVWKGNATPAMAGLPVKLSPATRYKWTVMTSAGVLGEAPFETLAPEGIARVEKSRAGARRFSDRVLHAFLLQDLGATQDAREAWAALARERPDLPELAALAR